MNEWTNKQSAGQQPSRPACDVYIFWLILQQGFNMVSSVETSARYEDHLRVLLWKNWSEAKSTFFVPEVAKTNSKKNQPSQQVASGKWQATSHKPQASNGANSKNCGNMQFSEKAVKIKNTVNWLFSTCNNFPTWQYIHSFTFQVSNLCEQCFLKNVSKSQKKITPSLWS